MAGAGHRFLGHGHAREPIVEAIGNEQELLRAVQTLGRFGGQLVEGIERHELDAGFGENSGPIHFGASVRHPARGTGIAIMEGRFQQRAFLVEQQIIDAPGVRADAGNGQFE